MYHLDWPIEKIPFVTRETDSYGKSVVFRCQRDFLFYALKFFGAIPHVCHPEEIESKLFRYKLPFWLIWTMFHMKQSLYELNQAGLRMIVNDKPVSSLPSLIFALIVPKPVSLERLMIKIENAVARGTVTGLDISLSHFGLVDHVLFVYGYDDDYIYVLDTLELNQLPYEKIISGDRFLMKISKSEVKKRLGVFSRIWEIVPHGTIY